MIKVTFYLEQNNMIVSQYFINLEQLKSMFASRHDEMAFDKRFK